MQLALIVDKSEAYIGFQRERILSDWGVQRSDTRATHNLDDAPAVTLFGTAPTVLLTIEKPEELKKFIETATSLGADGLTERFPSGVLASCVVDRRQTKKLESLVTSLGGEVFAPPGSKEDPLSVRLVREMGLRPNVRDFLLSYVGQDHEALLPMVQTLSRLPKEHRKRITEEDVYCRLPQPPGSVAPWEIESHIMAGNVGESVSIARRINQHSSYLLWLSILKKKIVTAHRAAVILGINPRIQDEALAEALDVPVRGLYFTKKTAKNVGVDRLEQSVLTIARSEAMMKGSSAAPGEALSEKLIVELCMLMGGK